VTPRQTAHQFASPHARRADQPSAQTERVTEPTNPNNIRSTAWAQSEYQVAYRDSLQV